MSFPKSWLAGVTIFVTLAACSSVVVDTSVEALASGDYTAIGSACGAVPGGGLDICRVREGTDIASSWKLVVPTTNLQGGEVDVYFRDIHKSYAVTGMVVDIPWKDVMGGPKWTSDMDGEAMALVVIRWKDAQGIEQVTKFRGFAKIVVTKEGYDRLPIDSGYAAFKGTCKVQYSTAGRSALECK